MSMVKHFDANTKGRDFVVGDIHGCTELLEKVLKEAGFNKETDRCFSVGDLADRGPDSHGAMALLDEPWFHPVMGNHEQILIICVSCGGDWNWWRANGGEWAVEVDRESLHEFSQKMQALPYAITVGEGKDRFNVIHAEFLGSDEDLDAGEFDPHIAERMLWGRAVISGQLIAQAIHSGLSPTYCGHTILKQPQQIGMQKFIDTGAFLPSWGKDGYLTLVEPKTGQMWRSK